MQHLSHFHYFAHSPLYFPWLCVSPKRQDSRLIRRSTVMQGSTARTTIVLGCSHARAPWSDIARNVIRIWKSFRFEFSSLIFFLTLLVRVWDLMDLHIRMSFDAIFLYCILVGELTNTAVVRARDPSVLVVACISGDFSEHSACWNRHGHKCCRSLQHGTRRPPFDPPPLEPPLHILG